MAIIPDKQSQFKKKKQIEGLIYDGKFLAELSISSSGGKPMRILFIIDSK